MASFSINVLYINMCCAGCTLNSKGRPAGTAPTPFYMEMNNFSFAFNEGITRRDG